ncbi:MAG TPA: hypothetical protein VGO27_18015 [Candidatus Acidoferrum sp.]|nr:hypothetical protein [Candidatus Acidoferrum sp.]
MMIIGVDYHPSFQTIAFLMEETGECGEQELHHSDGQAEKFYRDLQQRGIRVRVGMEATGYSRWFERLLAELEFEEEAAGGKSISSNLGAGSGESRSATLIDTSAIQETNRVCSSVPPKTTTSPASDAFGTNKKQTKNRHRETGY